MKICSKCNTLHDKNGIYCSRACANSRVQTTESNQKRSEKLLGKPSKLKILFSKIYFCQKCNKIHKSYKLSNDCCANIERRDEILRHKLIAEGLYYALYRCSCKVCGLEIVARSPSKYCKQCKQNTANKSSQYTFKFNIFEYPELFDLDAIEEIGFYAPGGKSGKWNLSGLSRDHKVSVSEAVANNYNPYYISHPCNCELMLHSENNKKNGNSSITYEQLVELVNLFDNNRN